MSADSATAATAAPTLTVTVFSKDDCAICVNTENTFRKKGVPFTEINVQQDLEPRDEFGGKTPLEHVMETFGRQMPAVLVQDDLGFAVNSWTGANMFELHQTIKLFEAKGLLIPEDERQAA